MGIVSNSENLDLHVEAKLREHDALQNLLGIFTIIDRPPYLHLPVGHIMNTNLDPPKGWFRLERQNMRICALVSSWS
jgi:hypothetical protein